MSSDCQREPLARTVTVTGTLAAEEQVTLSLKVTGRLEELLRRPRSPVRKGQVIARLTPTDFELRLRQADAALQQARARLGLRPDRHRRHDRHRRARRSCARRRPRSTKRAGSATASRPSCSAASRRKRRPRRRRRALEIADGRYQDALEEVRNRQAVLAQRRSELALAQQQLEDTVLRSPIDGVVRERHGVRRRVSRRRHAGRHRRAPASAAPAACGARARGHRRCASGRRCASRSKAIPTVHEGRVVAVSPAIAEGTRTLPVEAEVPNPNGTLRPGTFANADIVTSRERRRSSFRRPRWSSFAGVEKVLRRQGRQGARAARHAPAGASATASRSSRASRAGDLVIVDARRPGRRRRRHRRASKPSCARSPPSASSARSSPR